MAHCKAIPLTPVDQDSDIAADAAAAPDRFVLALTETEARYIRWRMYKAKREDGPRRRATAIHAALVAAGVPD